MLGHQGSRDTGSEQVSDLENYTVSATYKLKCRARQGQLKNMPPWVSKGAQEQGKGGFPGPNRRAAVSKLLCFSFFPLLLI